MFKVLLFFAAVIALGYCDEAPKHVPLEIPAVLQGK